MKHHSTCLALLCVLALLAGPADISAVSTLRESGPEFLSGDLSGAKLKSGALVLGDDTRYLGNWTRLASGWPDERFDSEMVFDTAAGVGVMFGGKDFTHHRDFGDTWTVDAGTLSWTDQTPAGSPPPRFRHAMAYDASSGSVVMFGGTAADAGYLSETWTYNVSRNAWAERHPPTAPSKRDFHSMACDRSAGLVVLFGGQDAWSMFCETWTFDVRTGEWAKRSPSSFPPARARSSMAYVESIGAVLLFGGADRRSMYGDLWSYDTALDEWTNITPTISPPARCAADWVYDSQRDRLVLFGGYSAGWPQNDTWIYNVSTGQWSGVFPPSSPPARDAHVMVRDERNDLILLFSGTADGSRPVGQDFWTFNSSTARWTRLETSGYPHGRYMQAMAFDSARKVAVMFGGYSMEDLSDTWTFNPQTGAWSNRTGAVHPSKRRGAAAAFDVPSGSVILFGGFDGSDPYNWHRGDTWAFSAGSGSWSQLSPTASPSPRCYHALAYDERNGQTVLFGGETSNGKATNETWAFSLGANKWARKNPPASPPARTHPGLAYDRQNGVLVLFGGFGSTPLDDTWTYNLTTDSWTRLHPPVSPPARYRHALAYDASRGIVCLSGGNDGYGALDDQWVLDVKNGTWAQAMPEIRPGPLSSPALVYSTLDETLLLFGGNDGQSPVKGGTWVFGLKRNLLAGSFTSRPVDLGGKAYFGTVRWDWSRPAGTGLGVQLRTAGSPADLGSAPFVGPDGTPGTAYNISGSRLSAVHNGSRYMQYRVELFSGSPTQTPALRSLSVDYNRAHELAFLSPGGEATWSGRELVRWTVNDPDNDTMTTDLSVENGSASVVLASDLPGDTTSWEWDTLGFPNGVFRLRLTAHDSNSLIPLSVETVSGNITVANNHVPAATLLGPPDGSVTGQTEVRLSWTGADADGDPLTYAVHIAGVRFTPAGLPPAVTTTDASSFLASNLTNGSTYFWAIVPGDGKVRGNCSQIWSFRVDVSVGNTPPRLASVGNLTIRAGEELVYNMSAADADDDPLEYSLVGRPPGMSLDARTGQLRWNTTGVAKGNYSCRVRVSDGRGGGDECQFTVQVLEAPSLPVEYRRPGCRIGSPANGTRVSQRTTVLGESTNGTYPVSAVQIQLDSGAWLPAKGLGNWTFDLDPSGLKNGNHTLRARSWDGHNYSDASEIVLVFDGRPKSTGKFIPGFGAILSVIASMAAALGRGRKAPARCGPAPCATAGGPEAD